MNQNDWVGDVLHFWFDEVGPDSWFARDDAIDAAIANRFKDLWLALKTRIPTDTLLKPDAALAATIVLDQFPRNMFRGTSDAFVTDRLALALSRNAVAEGLDTEMSDDHRIFLYMPFMHSESLDDQERCVELFSAYEEQAPYAIEHRDIIAKFGRFPHRNRALGRESSDEERTFLSEHQGFGQ